MKRKRLRKEWRYKVYRYGLMTNEGMPSSWEEEHARLTVLWNELLLVRENSKKRINELENEDRNLFNLKSNFEKAIESSEKTWEAIKSQRMLEGKKHSMLLQEMHEKLREKKTLCRESGEKLWKARKEHKISHKEKYVVIYEKEKKESDEVIKKCPAYWANKEQIKRSFEQAKQKGKMKCKKENGRNYLFAHRYTGGGIEAKKLHNRNSRCQISRIDWERIDISKPQRQWKKDARGKVWFEICGTKKEFACVFHRPLPQNNIVKSAILSGKRQPGGKIKWFLSVACEEPPFKMEKNVADEEKERFGFKKEKLAVVHSGWKMTVQGLIFGYSLDLHGGYRRELFLPNKILALRSKIDEAKSKLEKTEEESEKLKLRKNIKNMWRRLTGHRDDFYHNLAHDLCDIYEKIVIEKLSLKKLGNAKTMEEKGKESRYSLRYKNLAAIGIWKEILKKVAEKRNTEIIEIPSNYLSVKCSRCEWINELNVKKCEQCGSEIEKEQNAARNLLKTYYEKLRKQQGESDEKEVCVNDKQNSEKMKGISSN